MLMFVCLLFPKSKKIHHSRQHVHNSAAGSLGKIKKIHFRKKNRKEKYNFL